MISVAAAISGVVLFAWSDGFTDGNLQGILLVLGAALGAALYKVSLKRRVGDADIFQMALFLSFLALFNLLVFWLLVVILHFTGVESLSEVYIPWSFLCSNAALALVFDFAINFGIAFTFPIFISLGTILGIPLSALIDIVVRREAIAAWKFPSTVLIVGGFLMMLLPISDSKWVHKKVKQLCCIVWKRRARDDEPLKVDSKLDQTVQS